MNVYCLVTPSHLDLYQQWFLRSLPEDCHAVPLLADEPGQSYAEGDWHRVVGRKFELLHRAFEQEPENGVFVFSDVDICFYRPFATEVTQLVHGHDVLFQHNRPTLPRVPENLCTGFMIIRNNTRSRAFFAAARACLEGHDRPDIGDQKACIEVLEREPASLRFGFLPKSYWSPGSGRGRWYPGVALMPPAELVLHHANHTVGISNKTRQLEAVRSAISGLSWTGSDPVAATP